MGAKEILKQYWGYDAFRPMQVEIISAAAEGRDVLAILPTGGGKSVCFQVPALTGNQLTDAIRQNVYLMNPMNFVGNKEADNAPHWYVRHGARDRDTAFPVPVAFATKLQNAGLDVDFLLA